MDGLLRHRAVHYLLLLAVGAAISLVNLGRPTLWDEDEGLNAEAAREMYESGNWVVPKFNFQLRDAKPALLYWLEASAYSAFGVNEFSARLPSALAVIVAALSIYELGRAMFSIATGLLSALVLISSLLVSGSAHFANPDALLLACTSLSFLSFWLGFAPRRAGEEPRRGWFVPFGAACALGMLTKGPIALVLPSFVVSVFLAWQRQLRYLWDRRLLLGATTFVVIAMPWYAMVTVETRGAFASGFFVKNNVERFLSPMNTHYGHVWYHPLALLIGFEPWSIFLLPTLWHTVRSCVRRPVESIQPDLSQRLAAHRMLICWFVSYLVFFSLAKTKLPSYVLPLYPALALMTARFLDEWRLGQYSVRRSLMACSLTWLFGIGVTTSAFALIVGGVWRISNLMGKSVDGMETWAWLGLVPVAAAILAMGFLAAGRRGAIVAVVCGSAVMAQSIMLGGAAEWLNSLKASRELIRMAGALHRDRDVRLANFEYFPPSLTFYGQRMVQGVHTDEQAVQFLANPVPGYLFMLASDWERLRKRFPDSIGEPLARHWDMYRNCEVVVIGNRPLNELAERQ